MADTPEYRVRITRVEDGVLLRWRWELVRHFQTGRRSNLTVKSGFTLTERGARRDGRQALEARQTPEKHPKSYFLDDVEDGELEHEFERLRKELERRKGI